MVLEGVGARVKVELRYVDCGVGIEHTCERKCRSRQSHQYQAQIYETEKQMQQLYVENVTP